MKLKFLLKIAILATLLMGGYFANAVTLYSEDFSNDNGVGCNSGCTNPGDANWSLAVVGAPDLAGAGDHCIVTAGYLEWKDLASSSFANSAEWLSASITTPAINVAISIDYNLNGAFINNGANLDFYYRIDGGAWVMFDSQGSQGSLSGTATVSGLSYNTSFEVRVAGFTGNASSSTANIDNIIVTGDFACSVTNLTAGTQTACEKYSNSYTQEVTVTFSNDPGSGTLDVNGQSFSIGTSPRTVILTGLNADGAAVSVTAVFSDAATCTMTTASLFTAPAFCGCSTNAGSISK